MRDSEPESRGYSMVELLTVLAIVGILSVIGVSMIVGNRSEASVRAVLDEMEGTLLSAQTLASATGRDVTLASQGDWDATTTTPLILARSTVSPPNPPAIVAAGQTDSASFKLARVYNGSTPTGLAREHASAGIVTAAQSSWWTTSMMAIGGRSNDDIRTKPPFSDSTSAFNGILNSSTANLFQGGAASAISAAATATNAGYLQVSGSSKRFQSTVWIEVVGLRGGAPYPGAPMGLLVVQTNGGGVLKFYNPGVVNGDGHWRRM